MAFDIDGLLDLWTGELEPGPAAEAAFARFYTDPVVVNGTPFRLADLVERALAVQDTYAPVQREVLQVCDAGDTVAVVFRMGGRLVGPLTTTAGVLQPTGEVVVTRVIDVLTLTDGRISSLWMTADELGTLAAIGAVQIVQPDAGDG